MDWSPSIQYGAPRRPSEHGDDGPRWRPFRGPRFASLALGGLVSKNHFHHLMVNDNNVGRRTTFLLNTGIRIPPIGIAKPMYPRTYVCTYARANIHIFRCTQHCLTAGNNPDIELYASINTHSFDLAVWYLCVRINIHARHWTLYARVSSTRFRWLAHTYTIYIYIRFWFNYPEMNRCADTASHGRANFRYFSLLPDRTRCQLWEIAFGVRG